MGPTRARTSGTKRLKILYAGSVIESEAQRAGVQPEGSKVINRDWVNHHACSQPCSHFIYIGFNKLF